MNFLRKFFKAAWVMVFKPMVMAPVNVFAGGINDDTAKAAIDRTGVVNLVALIALIVLSIYMGPTVTLVKWATIAYGAGMGMTLSNVAAHVKMFETEEELENSFYGLGLATA